MRIVNLMENTEGRSGCRHEHGLSFYVETEKSRLLVDTGATDAFMENAGKLGIDLKQVDMVILSHGHYDHGGGLYRFAEQNPNARIFMQSLAGEEYYHQKGPEIRYIGIDRRLLQLPQVELVKGDLKIEDGIFLFQGVKGRKWWPPGNRELKVKQGELLFQDDFGHEQYLVLEEKNKRILMSGCAHNGIINILDRFKEIYGTDPDVVISGFHMRNKSGYTEEELEIIRGTAGELKKTNITFYTGHCTGELPYRILKESLGKQLSYVHSGDEIYC